MPENDNQRRPLESIRNWRNRLLKRNKEGSYGGELEPAVVTAEKNRGTLEEDARTLGRAGNDNRVGQKSLFGERRYVAPSDRSIAQRIGNWFTDVTHLTSPPTFQDGYRRTLNAEVPISESAQGKELERMKDTAVKDAGLFAIAAAPYSLWYEPIATGMMVGTGAAVYGATKGVMNAANNFLQNNYNVKIHPKVINTISTAASIPTAGIARNYGNDVTRRGLELIMHETPASNPAPAVQQRWGVLTGRQKMDALKYVFTGKGKNYFSNWLDYAPYKGVGNDIEGEIWTSFEKDSPDAIRSYLYDEPMKGFNEVKDPDYGIFTNYIARNYPGKKIRVYENDPSANHFAPVREPVEFIQKPFSTGLDSSMSLLGTDGVPYDYNAAGHILQRGKAMVDGQPVFLARQQDIYKFNPTDYWKKWMSADRGKGLIKNLPLKWGLNVVNHYGTPFIVRTPWYYDKNYPEIGALDWNI